MIDISYSEFTDKNARNAVTIKKISKSDNRVYLEGDRNSLSYEIRPYFYANMSIDIETLIRCVMRNGLHITNPSLLKEFFIKSEISNSIKTMKDYLKSVPSEIENSKLINDNLLVIKNRWSYQCGPDGESGTEGYELYATIQNNRFYFIATHYDEDNTMCVKGSTDSFVMCLRMYKLSKQEIEAALVPDSSFNFNRELSANFKRTNTQIKLLSDQEYEQCKKNILNKK